MTTRGLPLSPERRAALEAALLDGAGYSDPRLVGYSCSTIVRHRRRLGLSPTAKAAATVDQPVPPPEKPAPYRPGGSAADRRIVELEAEVGRLRSELKRAHRTALDDEAMRELLGRIGSTTVRPPEWMISPAAPAVGRGKTPEVPVALVSDWHGGEVVSRAGVRGYNAFSPAILEERVRRLASSIIRIADEYGPGAYAGFVLATHGDMLGVKGGDGIIGSIGPIMRGEIKVRGQVSTLGLDYDVALMGHWHQELWLPRAIVNNTLKGFDEYARLKLRAPPTPPTQSLFFVHPRRGITSRWSVQVEAGSFDRAAPWVSWQQAVAAS